MINYKEEFNNYLNKNNYLAIEEKNEIIKKPVVKHIKSNHSFTSFGNFRNLNPLNAQIESNKLSKINCKSNISQKNPSRKISKQELKMIIEEDAESISKKNIMNSQKILNINNSINSDQSQSLEGKVVKKSSNLLKPKFLNIDEFSKKAFQKQKQKFLNIKKDFRFYSPVIANDKLQSRNYINNNSLRGQNIELQLIIKGLKSENEKLKKEFGDYKLLLRNQSVSLKDNEEIEYSKNASFEKFSYEKEEENENLLLSKYKFTIDNM